MRVQTINHKSEVEDCGQLYLLDHLKYFFWRRDRDLLFFDQPYAVPHYVNY